MSQLTTAPTHLERQLKRWEFLRHELEHPAIELTIEEFAPVLATFHALKRAGIEFDPTLCALMSVLERQVIGSFSDSDDDKDEGEI